MRRTYCCKSALYREGGSGLLETSLAGVGNDVDPLYTLNTRLGYLLGEKGYLVQNYPASLPVVGR